MIGFSMRKVSCVSTLPATLLTAQPAESVPQGILVSPWPGYPKLIWAHSFSFRRVSRDHLAPWSCLCRSRGCSCQCRQETERQRERKGLEKRTALFCWAPNPTSSQSHRLWAQALSAWPSQAPGLALYPQQRPIYFVFPFFSFWLFLYSKRIQKYYLKVTAF